MEDKNEDDSQKKKRKINYDPDPDLLVTDEFGHDSNRDFLNELGKKKKIMKKENKE